VKTVYSPRYEVSLPGHIWPTTKYRLIAERLAGRVDSIEPVEASWEDLALVHTADYLDKLRTNTLTAEDIATLELPWQPGLAEAFSLMVGGTCGAAAAALEDGRSAHLGGGLHHAFAGHGEGFCPLNDVAVAVRVLQRDRAVRRAAIVDCDVHHGNGTSMIFERDPEVFTFSIHQQRNYPLFKPRSDLDVGLEDGASDARYLEALAAALPRVFETGPEIVVYLAGVRARSARRPAPHQAGARRARPSGGRCGARRRRPARDRPGWGLRRECRRHGRHPRRDDRDHDGVLKA
jgi:acetoin utilization deacetylase AcuC-like enzyme